MLTDTPDEERAKQSGKEKECCCCWCTRRVMSGCAIFLFFGDEVERDRGGLFVVLVSQNRERNSHLLKLEKIKKIKREKM